MKQADFVSLVMPFKDKVFRLAKRLLVSREEAEDATQEILLKLWKNKEKIENYNNVEAFSMTMTKNFCLDRLKSKQAQNLKIVHSNYTDNNSSLQKQVEAYQESYRINEIRFKNGVSNFLNYVTSKNNLDNAKVNLANTKYEYLLRVKVLDYYRGLF